MNGEHLLPIRKDVLLDRIDDLYASVGHEDIDVPKLLHDGIDAPIDLVFRGHVHCHTHRAAALRENLLGNGVGRFGPEVGDGNASAFGRQGLGNRLADAAGRAGHHGNLAFEFLHASLLAGIHRGIALFDAIDTKRCGQPLVAYCTRASAPRGPAVAKPRLEILRICAVITAVRRGPVSP